MSRRDEIRNRLAEFLLEQRGCAVVCPSKETLAQFPVTGHLFGWFPPMPVDDDPHLLVVSFSPELIDEMTAYLDYQQLDVYLGVVEAILDGYLEAFESGGSLDDAREQVESELFDADPDALALLSEIEARALDTGLVRRPA